MCRWLWSQKTVFPLLLLYTPLFHMEIHHLCCLLLEMYKKMFHVTSNWSREVILVNFLVGERWITILPHETTFRLMHYGCGYPSDHWLTLLCFVTDRYECLCILFLYFNLNICLLLHRTGLLHSVLLVICNKFVTIHQVIYAGSVAFENLKVTHARTLTNTDISCKKCTSSTTITLSLLSLLRRITYIYSLWIIKSKLIHLP